MQRGINSPTRTRGQHGRVEVADTESTSLRSVTSTILLTNRRRSKYVTIQESGLKDDHMHVLWFLGPGSIDKKVPGLSGSTTPTWIAKLAPIMPAMQLGLCQEVTSSSRISWTCCVSHFFMFLDILCVHRFGLVYQ